MRRSWSFRILLGVAAMLVAAAASAEAQTKSETSPSPPAEEEPVGEPATEAAEAEREAPENPRKLEVLPGAMARGIGKVEGRAIWLSTPDRKHIFRFSGFVHLDMRVPVQFRPDGTTVDTIALPRRARFAPEGTVFRNLDYRFMFDPAVDRYPLDAYLDWRARPEINLRVGKFKSPFGFERRARAFALVFNERGYPTFLAPNRDVGVFLHGQTVDGFFSYDIAGLSGAPDFTSVTELRGSPDFSGRIYLQPFRLWESQRVLRHFGVGYSWTWGTETGRENDPRLGSMQTLGRERFFSYRDGREDGPIAHADGDRRRWSVHGHWRHKRVNTMWEYVWSGQRMTAGGATRFVANQAWQAYAGVALTDDEWTFFGIVPRRPFDPNRGRYGAVAVAARYQGLRIDPLAFPALADPDVAAQRAHAGAVSLQWVHNENLGTQLDFETTFFGGGAPGGANRPPELAVAFRIQAFY